VSAMASTAKRILAIQNMEGEGFGRVERHLRRAGHGVSVVRAEREALPRPDEWDAVIVGGTPLAAYEWDRHAFLRDEAAFLRRAAAASVPCLGICFGSQFLAQLLGGRAFKAARKEIGRYEVHLTDEGRRDALLAGFPPRFPAFQWHGDTFDLPPGASLLARGEGCRNQLFRRDLVVGVQFHPEVTAGDAARWAGMYAEELVDAGKTAEQVVAECREVDLEMERLAAVLLDNFVATIPQRFRLAIPGARRSSGRPAAADRGRAVVS